MFISYGNNNRFPFRYFSLLNIQFNLNKYELKGLISSNTRNNFLRKNKKIKKRNHVFTQVIERVCFYKIAIYVSIKTQLKVTMTYYSCNCNVQIFLSIESS